MPADAALGEVDWRHGEALPPGRATTLPELIARCVAEFGDASVLVENGRACSWRDLDRWSARLAGALAPTLPMGERLVILAPNGVAHLVAELAAWRLGAIAAPVFTGFGAPRLRELLATLAPRAALVADPAHLGFLPSACQAFDAERLRELVEGTGATADRSVSARTPCLIQHTSGSTGQPRGVTLCHDNLASQQAAFARLWPEVGPGDRLASYLPWHHSFGALAERLWALCRGAETTLVPGGGRDRERFVATMRAVKPTVFMSVPKMHAVVLGEHLIARGQLRWAFTAGAPLPEEQFAAYAALGVPVYEGWGLTETSPSATITPPGSTHAAGVVGQPIAGVSVGVERGTGRILVRGPNVMLGYFNRPSPCLSGTSDGTVIDSGDLGAWTPQGLKLTGRSDHVLKLPNGEKACAPEIEAALAHPAIHHAVALLDGELAAIVEPRPGHADTELAELARLANERQQQAWLCIARLYVLAQPLTIENGGLTASMKVARGAVLQAWKRWRVDGGDAFRAIEVKRSARA